MKKKQKGQAVKEEKVLQKEKSLSVVKLVQGSFKYQTKEYFNNSTLHGIRYIAEDGRPFREKFMWFCFIATGIISAIIIIVSLWEKFQTNPTITGLDTDFNNQLLIFPTVVVCPSDAYDKNLVFEVVESKFQLDPNTTEITKFLQQLTSLSYGTLPETFNAYQQIEDKSMLRNVNLRELIFSVFVTCNETISMCKYKDEDIECCDYFQPIFTEYGYCFAFNSKYRDQVDREVPIEEKNHLLETDKKWGLKFVPIRNTMVYLHSHKESSGWDYKPHVVWEPTFAVDLLISMKETYTTDQARQLSIQQRKCIFENERKMIYRGEDYTFTGCMRDCRIRNSLRLCGCVAPFYVSDKALKICDAGQFECLANYVQNITNIDSCLHCELGCFNIVYDIEKFTKTLLTDTKASEHSSIEYLTWPIIRYKREVLFGWVDLLVSFGGIAGLFLGFSLLSSVEIVYYFTLRAFCMVYKNRDELTETMTKNKQAIESSLETWTVKSGSVEKKKPKNPSDFILKPRNIRPSEIDPYNVLLGNNKNRFYGETPSLSVKNWGKLRNAIQPQGKDQPWKVWTVATKDNPYGGYLP